MATFELTKENTNCSNIYFIDENTCAGNSLQVINDNWNTIYNNLYDLTRFTAIWDNINTTFVHASAAMIETLLNIENIRDTVVSPLCTVQALSGNWNKQFSLYYPTMFDINDWVTLGSLNQDAAKLNPWLTLNFPPENFPDHQIVNIFVSTNQDIPFKFSFIRFYEENCAPNGGTTTVTCDGCNSADQDYYRYQGCNHHGGAAGYGACDNAYSHCGTAGEHTKDSNSYTCKADGGQRLTGLNDGPLKLGLSDDYPANISIQPPIKPTDKCFARIFNYQYVKLYNDIDGASWNLLTS
jgi:hypothetical protein